MHNPVPATWKWAIFLSLAVLCTGNLHSQTVLYITDGNSQNLQAIDTTNGATVFSRNSVVGSYDQPFGLAVTGSIWILNQYSSPTGANQYGLDGTPSGTTSSFSFPVSQFLDGTTDGVHNYTLAWNGSNAVDIYSANADWTNLQVMISSSTISALNLTSDLAGITYDLANHSLWISSASNIYQLSLSGTLLSQFALAHSERGSLAYQASTDTLWFVPNYSSAPIEQYSKSGTLLTSLTTGSRSGNVWGAEFSAVPEPCTWMMLGLGLGLVALLTRRRA